jgi:hypothetical protein
MEMLVRVDVIERQAGCSERGELSLYLGRKLPPRGRRGEDLEAHANEVSAEPPVAVDQRRQPFRRQHGTPLNQHDMETDPERRQRPRPPHRISDGLASDHQARCSDDALTMRPLDCLVDLDSGTEIVGGDNKAL